MKKVLFALVAFFATTLGANAMSFEQAREQALFLTDKMAYELNLTDDQYEAAYEINLDYLLGINTESDLYGVYWTNRNLDMSYILAEWQYRAYCDALYFYRPLYWGSGYWHFRIFARYPHRTFFYFGRPAFYHTYHGGHSWHHHNGSYYHGRTYGLAHRSGGNGHGMRDNYRGSNNHGGYSSNHNGGYQHNNHGNRPNNNGGVRPEGNRGGNGNVNRPNNNGGMNRPNNNGGVRPEGNRGGNNGNVNRPNNSTSHSFSGSTPDRSTSISGGSSMRGGSSNSSFQQRSSSTRQSSSAVSAPSRSSSSSMSMSSSSSRSGSLSGGSPSVSRSSGFGGGSHGGGFSGGGSRGGGFSGGSHGGGSHGGGRR